MPKIYTDEFKQSALELLDDGMTQKQVCAEGLMQGLVTSDLACSQASLEG